ncbi:NADPH dehydrogenase NamA [Microaerobacter geothermalis]|uniref:NADPH dehydrogenase NamA n=1 Tax=Microaerobacter geothermalis TaxID=674972 RepID=UPI001F28FC7D|nr:NADPH dehydrogenase NamA [Microaerobacter geothermalis]MCF6094444.1 NADPH dehydrogenase NamA [Microaerobacter geothermalis]
MVALLFQPLMIKNMTIKNRIMMSPMCMYSATLDGKPTNWHFIHYPTRAIGGVGLIMLEATAVEPRGRISNRDLGIWDDKHIDGLRRIVDLCHENGSKVGIQLAHAGRKCVVPGEKIVAPSSIPFNSDSPTPEELTEEEIEKIIKAFADGARRAKEIGLDVVEIHGAHGYLIHEFLSPLTNSRSDQYGGPLENRMLFLRKVIRSVKREWGEERPLFLRLSASDYAKGGITIEDTISIAEAAYEEGVDLIDVSSGGLLPITVPVYPGYQVGFSEAIKKKLNQPTATVGLITTPELAEEILFNGRADLIALGRELLRNPYWPLEAARMLNHEIQWPEQYNRAKK